MSKDRAPLEPIGPPPTSEARQGRAARYMARMCALANQPGMLAPDTVRRLERSSATVQDMGLPDLVLAKGDDGDWRVVDRGAPESVMPEPVTKKRHDVTESPDVTINVTEKMPVTKKRGRPPKAGALTSAERKRAQRERERERGE